MGRDVQREVIGSTQRTSSNFGRATPIRITYDIERVMLLQEMRLAARKITLRGGVEYSDSVNLTACSVRPVINLVARFRRDNSGPQHKRLCATLLPPIPNHRMPLAGIGK